MTQKNNPQESTSEGLRPDGYACIVIPVPPATESRLSFVEAGARGGRARAKKLTAKQRSESASKAAKARWAKRREKAEGVAA